MLKRLNPASLPPTAGQSQVVISEAGRLAHISGQVALDGNGNLIGAGDLGAQLKQVLTNLEGALHAAGATTEDVIKITVYVVGLDMSVHGVALGDELGDLSRFGHPAATLISVAGLARPDFLVEIEAIAALP